MREDSEANDNGDSNNDVTRLVLVKLVDMESVCFHALIESDAQL